MKTNFWKHDIQQLIKLIGFYWIWVLLMEAQSNWALRFDESTSDYFRGFRHCPWQGQCWEQGCPFSKQPHFLPIAVLCAKLRCGEEFTYREVFLTMAYACCGNELFRATITFDKLHSSQHRPFFVIGMGLFP